MTKEHCALNVGSNHGGYTSADIVCCGEEASVSTGMRPSPLYLLSLHASVQMRKCGCAGAPRVIFREGRMPFLIQRRTGHCREIDGGAHKCVCEDLTHLSQARVVGSYVPRIS